MTGTTHDSYNTNSIWEALHCLKVYQSGIYLKRFSYFKEALTLNSDESAFLLENIIVGDHDQIKTQNKLSLQQSEDQFDLKAHMYPALKSLVINKSTHDLIFEGTHGLTQSYPGISTPL